MIWGSIVMAGVGLVVVWAGLGPRRTRDAGTAALKERMVRWGLVGIGVSVVLFAVGVFG